MKRARLIVNPASGTDRAPLLLPRLNAALRTLVDRLDITMTVDSADAERAAARALEEGSEALYVAGGDGTLNAALRGLLGTGHPLDRLPIGVIPLGTGNDFAKALGLGDDAEIALQRLLDARTIDVDIGMLNDRPFVNTSAGGFVADVSEAVTEGLKDATGKLAYLIGGARALLGSEPFTARLTGLDGADAQGAAWQGDLSLEMFAICNARTIGGGYPIAPDAAIDDGRLDVFLVKQMPLFEFVGVLQSIAAGEHRHDPRVLHFRAAAFDLAFDRTVRVNTDGELFAAERCQYRVRHRAGRFFAGPRPWTVRA
jgi:YegS/Rv2252/BmrU family lipid kinase